MPRTGFDPRAHGFHFASDFVDKVVTVPGYGEVATDGRSGGMAFAALDYWFAGLPVPSRRPDDFPDRAVPEDGTRLADFIHKRLFDSYASWSARQFLTWTLAEDHPTWSSPGVARLTGEELPRVRRSLEAGRPVVLGLVGARNYGDYRAHLSELRLAVRGPTGENLDRFLGGDGDPTPLEPGEERAVFKASDGFGTVAGSYAIAAGYPSEQGSWLGIPPGEPGAVDEVGVTVIPPPRRVRVTVPFTAVTVEDADTLGGRLALRLAVGDQAARWPEEGAVDVQDGKRFELDQRFDQVLNPSSVLAVEATGEDAGGSPAGRVREPYLGLDDWGAGEHAYRSRPAPATAERPGPDAGDGPWSVEYAVAVTSLEA